jgi:hypothetical protein
MPTLRWWLDNWRTISGPRLSKQRFGGRIDERHLTRRRIGTRLVINKSIGVMLARELSPRRADLIGACTEPHAEYLVR